MDRVSMSLALLLGLAMACGPNANPAAIDDDGAEPEIRLPPRDGQTFDCKDVPEEGLCKDDVAVYCDKRSSTIVSKRCGARSLACEESEKGARCVDSQGEEQEVPAEVDGPVAENDTGEDCDVYDFIGDCDGNTLKYCTKRNTLYVQDCGEMNAVCDFSNGAGYYGCMPPAECNAEGDICEGNAIKTCTIGTDGWETDLWPCEEGTACQEADGFASCETIVPASCEDLGTEGKCIDQYGQASEYQTKQWAYCQDGTIEKVTCVGAEMCVDVDGSGWVECAVP
jgi:hypothetical protein